MGREPLPSEADQAGLLPEGVRGGVGDSDVPSLSDIPLSMRSRGLEREGFTQWSPSKLATELVEQT